MNEKISSAMTNKYDRFDIVVRRDWNEPSNFSAIKVEKSKVAFLNDFLLGRKLAELAFEAGILDDPHAAADHRISCGKNGASIGVYGKKVERVTPDGKKYQETVALDRFSPDRIMDDAFNRGFFKTLIAKSHIKN